MNESVQQSVFVRERIESLSLCCSMNTLPLWPLSESEQSFPACLVVLSQRKLGFQQVYGAQTDSSSTTSDAKHTQRLEIFSQSLWKHLLKPKTASTFLTFSSVGSVSAAKMKQPVIVQTLDAFRNLKTSMVQSQLIIITLCAPHVKHCCVQQLRTPISNQKKYN